MGKPKKNQLHQVIFPMVDATDFASVESAITSVVGRYYGVNYAGSAATTSGAVSKTASVVHSGIFRMTLKAAENNYDNMLLRVTSTGCADQILTWENTDYDDSDIYSIVVAGAGVSASGISDIESAMASRLSDILSAAQQTNSRALVIQSLVSDVDSALTSQYTAGQNLTASAVSDIDSRLASRLSDILSAATQINSRVLVAQSFLSDIDSALTSQFTAGHPLNASDMSDIRSAITLGGGILASGISDIESALASRLSDILSAAQQVNSRVLVAQSFLSDIRSNVSDLQSDFQSRVPKAVATNSQLTAVQSDLRSQATAIQSDVKSGLGAITVTIGASDISDIVSGVIAAGGGATQSQVLVIVTAAKSDIKSQATVTYGMLSDFYSDFQSRVPKAVATNSQLSDLASDLKSYLLGISGLLSDVDSALTSQFTAGHPLNASDLSDIRSAITAATSDIKSQATANYATLSDFYSDFQSRVPKLAATSSQLTAVQSDIKSQATTLYNLMSDIQSDFQSRVPKVVATNSQLTAVQSDIRSQATAIQSDIKSAVGAGGGGTGATPAEVNAQVLDVLNVDTLIDGKTIVQALKIIGATTAGKLTGSGTGTEIFVGLDGVTTRVTGTVDSLGNRTGATYA